VYWGWSAYIARSVTSSGLCPSYIFPNTTERVNNMGLFPPSITQPSVTVNTSFWRIQLSKRRYIFTPEDERDRAKFVLCHIIDGYERYKFLILTKCWYTWYLQEIQTVSVMLLNMCGVRFSRFKNLFEDKNNNNFK